MTRIKSHKDMEFMSCEEIADYLDSLPNSYARECAVGELVSARFYDRAVYHAAMGYAKVKTGHRKWTTVNKHLEQGIISEKMIRPTGAGWATKTKRKPFKRGGRGANKSFRIKGAEIKRILLKDGPVPANGIMEASK